MPECPEIRLAGLADLAAIDTLERRSFTLDAQSWRSLRYLLTRANARTYMALDGERLLGDVILLYRRGARVARVYSIAVDTAARGRGVGLRLLDGAQADAAARGCTRLRAEVRISNSGSRGLFARAGYRETTRLVAYYPGGEDGVRLEKIGLTTSFAERVHG